jgi:hypothetical protein
VVNLPGYLFFRASGLDDCDTQPPIPYIGGRHHTFTIHCEPEGARPCPNLRAEWLYDATAGQNGSSCCDLRVTLARRRTEIGATDQGWNREPKPCHAG